MVDVREPQRAPDLSHAVAIRLIREDDIPWCVDLCKRRYSPEYDSESTEGWFRNIVLKGPLIFYAVRTDAAMMICNLTMEAWLPGQIVCNNVMLVSEEGAVWEEIALVRAALVWAKKRNCKEYRIWTDTPINLEMIARRVGCVPTAIRYGVKL